MKKLKQRKQNKMMNYDRKADVFYIGIKSGQEEECVEIAPGVNAEVDENGEVIGIEILNASEVLRPVSQARMPMFKNRDHHRAAVLSR
mgnify:CR=1 FL=1